MLYCCLKAVVTSIPVALLRPIFLSQVTKRVTDKGYLLKC
nr:MAG TPA: hypothetical protein [Caudoviricetes sp.]